MFDLIHGLIFLVILAVIPAVAWKCRWVKNRKQLIGVVLASLLIAYIPFFLPFENAFVTFPSPEAVLRYVKTKPMIQVAEGEESAVVLYRVDDTTTSQMVTKRKGDGYKIVTNPFSQQKVNVRHLHSDFVELLRIRGTDDYYLSFWGIEEWGKPMQVTDSEGTVFSLVIDESAAENYFTFHLLAHIPYHPDYVLYINGEPVVFDPK